MIAISDLLLISFLSRYQRGAIPSEKSVTRDAHSPKQLPHHGYYQWCTDTTTMSASTAPMPPTVAFEGIGRGYCDVYISLVSDKMQIPAPGLADLPSELPF